MLYKVQIQNKHLLPKPLTQKMLTKWVDVVLTSHRKKAELTLRLVEEDEMAMLNETFRHKSGPTNVLAFPSTLPAHIYQKYPFIGDVILAPTVIAKESLAQHISLTDHWAHIVIHGILHLLGYDHIKEADKNIMQTQEITLLKQVGVDNPYE